MYPSVPQSALPTRSQSSYDRLAKGLGYVSIALGVAELLAPHTLCKAIGIEGRENLVRAYGAREVATGLAILTSHDPTPWIWGRVAGDALDMLTVATGNAKKGKVAGALVGLAAVTALDVFCASGLTTEKGSRRTARANYGDRSGFPRGLDSSRGVARSFEVPRDMRIPEPLRGDAFQRRDVAAPAERGPPSPTAATGASVWFGAGYRFFGLWMENFGMACLLPAVAFSYQLRAYAAFWGKPKLSS